MVVSKICNGSQFEVEVVSLDGDPYSEIEGPDCPFVIAVPSASFEVRCTLLSHTSDHFCVTLQVDGTDVGYYLNAHHLQTSFKGFLVSGGKHNVYRRFRFAAPKKAQSSNEREAVISGHGDGHGRERPGDYLSSKVGTLCVSVYNTDLFACRGFGCAKCKSDRRSWKPRTNSAEGVAPATVNQSGNGDDDKKFYMAPSMSVKGGEEYVVPNGGIVKSRFHLRRRSDVPIMAIKLRCETAETLMLRKFLDPSNADHAQLLVNRRQREDDHQPNVLAPSTNIATYQPSVLAPLTNIATTALSNEPTCRSVRAGLLPSQTAFGENNWGRKGHGAVLLSVKPDAEAAEKDGLVSSGVKCTREIGNSCAVGGTVRPSDPCRTVDRMMPEWSRHASDMRKRRRSADDAKKPGKLEVVEGRHGGGSKIVYLTDDSDGDLGERNDSDCQIIHVRGPGKVLHV